MPKVISGNLMVSISANVVCRLIQCLSASVKPLLSQLLLSLGMLAALPATAAPSETPLFSAPPSLWEAGVGGGFAAGTREFDAAAGVGIGMPVLGSRGHHDFAIASLEYGWMLGQVVGGDHWYRGNWEVLGELFGGGQYHPDSAYIIGLTPHLRYNFATGSRWLPFLDAGAGVTATDIRNGDLSTTFEFNLQIGAGVRYFLRDNLALNLQYRFMHFSNAGIQQPNLGVNASTILVGLTWFFAPAPH